MSLDRNPEEPWEAEMWIQSSFLFILELVMLCSYMHIYFKLKQRENITDLTENGMARTVGVFFLRKPFAEYVKLCFRFLFKNHPQSKRGILSTGCCKHLLLGSVDVRLSGS